MDYPKKRREKWRKHRKRKAEEAAAKKRELSQRPDKWVCPVHKVKMITHSTIYGPRHQCPVHACTVAGWGGGTTSTPGDEATRTARTKAHAAFDPLWRDRRGYSRNFMYRRLAEFLGIDRKDCHIGMFNAEQCARVLEFCAVEIGEKSA